MQISLFEPKTSDVVPAVRLPRDYQERSFIDLRKALLNGWRCPVLYIPTGGGKTFVAVLIILSALARGKRVLFVVPLLSLLGKTIKSLEDAGITHIGVIQRRHARTDARSSIQVASKQTLIKRPELMQGFDIVIDDECHRLYAEFSAWMKRDAKTVFIGLSASPGTKGMGLVYDGVVMGATIGELLEKGAICPFEVYDAGHAPSRKGLKVSEGGDFKESQAEAVMSDKVLVADVYQMWVDRGSISKWFVFGQTCAHTKLLMESFEKAGVRCGYIDANTPQDERDSENPRSNAILCRYRRGEIDVLFSVGCLGTGVDELVYGLSLAYITRSRDKLTQDMGRGGRPAEGKLVCYVNDHGGNIENLGEPEDYDYSQLCRKDPKENGDSRIDEQEVAKPKKCGKCFMILPPKTSACPKCGEKTVPCMVETIEGKLVKREKTPKANKEHQAFFSELIWMGRKAGYKSNWAAMNFREKFGITPSGLKVRGKRPTDTVKQFVSDKKKEFRAKQKSTAQKIEAIEMSL